MSTHHPIAFSFQDLITKPIGAYIQKIERKCIPVMGRCQHEKKNKVNIQNYINIHICAQPAASVFADVYVGVKPHLCNVHTCPCTSAQKTCSKVHATLTAIKCTYIYTYTHMHTHTYAHEYTCACMTPSTR